MKRLHDPVTVLTVLLAMLCCATLASADVRLPSVVGPNMVLQRDVPAPIWGWADAGEAVTVSILDQTKNAQPDADGKWMVRLDPLATSNQPLVMTIKGKNTITLNNVLVGEVWICSGQSNMGFSVRGANNAEAEIEAAKYPKIRLLSVPLRGTQERQVNFNGKWSECSPATVPSFSAVGYFFGRKLHKDLGIPIGLVNCSWGGSSCEAWVRRDLLQSDDRYKPLLNRWQTTEETWKEEEARNKYEARRAIWKKKAAEAKAAGKQAPRPPRWNNPLAGQHRPGNLYNGMLYALMPYAIRGAIWYQGESNAGRAYQYRHLFPLMIRNWRDDWGMGEFPFYWVQLANFQARADQPGESAWAELREAQTMTLDAVPNGGQAVIIDIGDADDIHPRNKQDVGKRLALVALSQDYGQSVCKSGPLFKSMDVRDDGKVTVGFQTFGSKLSIHEGNTVKGFALAGENREWSWAEAKIVDDKHVLLSSKNVPKPVAVRYAWSNNPDCNLYDATGLPACPFRTDDWPGVTATAD